MCWASTSSAPGRNTSGSSSPSSIASSAARPSRYSKRLPGTRMPLLGSSSRWLARPIRCRRRELPFGAPIWTTRSTSPQSIPRSRLAVATSPRSLPAAIAASTFRRASTDKLPWWMPIGRPCSFSSHSFWKISSARPRVLENTSVVLCCSISRMTSRDRVISGMPAPRDLVLGIRIDRSGSAPGSPRTRSTSSMSASGASQER